MCFAVNRFGIETAANTALTTPVDGDKHTAVLPSLHGICDMTGQNAFFVLVILSHNYKGVSPSHVPDRMVLQFDW